MWLTLDNFTIVFWVAVIPAFLAMALIIFAVREPDRPKGLRQVKSPLSRAELVVMNIVYALAAYPAGLMSDKVDRITVLAAGIALLIAADLVLALTASL